MTTKSFYLHNTNIFNPTGSERGSTLLELLCSIVLLAIIAAGAINSARNGLMASRIGMERAQLLRKAQMIFRRIDRASSSALPNIVKTLVVSEPDTLHDALGNRHPLNVRPDPLRPNPSSSMISTIYPTLSLRLHRFGQATASDRYCLYRDDTPQRPSPGAVKSWLALSPSGQTHVRAEIRSLEGNSSCPSGQELRATLTPIENSIFTFRPPQKFLSRNELYNLLDKHFELIAVSEAYTLYVDSRGTLRRYSEHSQDNQPLIDGVASLIIGQDATAHSRLTLTAHLALDSRFQVTREFSQTFIHDGLGEINTLLLLNGGLQ